MTITRALPFLVTVLVLLAAPGLLPEPLLIGAIQVLIAVLFATAFGFLVGQAGLLSFGHAAYFGVGAFAAVHAMNALNGAGLLPTPLVPLAGAAMGLLMGVVAGYLSTTRSGTYFAMITLALAELLYAIAPNLGGLFGGEGGISSFRAPAWGISFGSPKEVYYLTLFWVVLSIGLLWAVTWTPFGRLALGLRENTQRLKFLGYNTHLLATMAFAISAIFSGIAGALQTLNIEAANYVVFDINISTVVVLNTFIGGARTFLGPAIGAAIMTFFGYLTADVTRNWLLYQGLIFVLVMMYMPLGIVGTAQAICRGELQPFKDMRVFILRAVGIIAIVAAAVLSAELLQRFFSTDYEAARLGGVWPPVNFIDYAWGPFALTTWAIPLLLTAFGGALLRSARSIAGTAAVKAAETQSRAAS